MNDPYIESFERSQELTLVLYIEKRNHEQWSIQWLQNYLETGVTRK